MKNTHMVPFFLSVVMLIAACTANPVVAPTTSTVPTRMPRPISTSTRAPSETPSPTNARLAARLSPTPTWTRAPAGFPTPTPILASPTATSSPTFSPTPNYETVVATYSPSIYGYSSDIQMKQTEENKTPFPYPDDWNFNISSVSFVDRQQGWLSAFIYDGTKDEETCLLRQSTDGGITWQVRDTIQPTIDWKKAEWFSPCRVTFLSDQVGWVYNPGLFTTRDGGKHWKDEGFGYYVHHEGEQQTGEAIVSLKIVGSTAWALRWSRVKGQNSQYQLIFFDPQKGWLPAETQPPTFYGTGYGISGDILPGANGKIWIFNPAGDAQDRHLLMTKDQGKTWEEVSLPNDISTCVNDLTISPDGTLWLFCTPTPLGAPGTPGSIYHLPDGNHTWKKLCHDYAKEGNLCWVASGETYLHTFTSKTTAFAGLRHASLIVTHDGGWHWSGALPYQDIGVSGGGFNDILFIDEQHGWVAYHNYVLITKDGGSHWSYTLVR